ncbi:MAG: prepilin-type N-terminal cleavage/methylation domain-containing protein [Planctomycetota bacterium]
MERESHGFTLIEIVISSVVLMIMMLAILGTFDVGQDVASLGSANLSAQTMSTRSVSEMTRALRQARIIGMDATGMWIQFQVPVDWAQVDSDGDGTLDSGDGDILDGADNIEWGAGDNLNWVARYTFEIKNPADPADPVNLLVEAEEGRAGIDVNGDGDTDDTFTKGCLREYVWDGGGTLRAHRYLTPYSIITTNAGGWGGDVDGDGVADPLFARLNDAGVQDATGHNIRISFFVFRVANKERTVLLHPTSIVETRN